MAHSISNFRHFARESLKRARTELAADDPHRLRYAALELRDAMEALTYDRAHAFRDEIPPEEYATWQPRKLMALLVDIDPLIGMTSTIAVGREEKYGKTAPQRNMKLLGTDVVFTLAELKDHYDALGSYLHIPSLQQLRASKMPDPEKLRKRCETVADAVEGVLNSRVWNVTLGNFATLDQCLNEECKKRVRKRIPVGKDVLDVQCFECKAEYTLALEPDGSVLWTPKTADVACSTRGCPEKMTLWSHELVPGTSWRCRGCGEHNELVVSVERVQTR